jgi:hypothetical protein
MTNPLDTTQPDAARQRGSSSAAASAADGSRCVTRDPQTSRALGTGPLRRNRRRAPSSRGGRAFTPHLRDRSGGPEPISARIADFVARLSERRPVE